MMKTYIPSDDMRTNPLSLIPGGSTIVVQFDTYQVKYTNIKHPSSFIAKILQDNTRKVISIHIDGKKSTING